MLTSGLGVDTHKPHGILMLSYSRMHMPLSILPWVRSSRTDCIASHSFEPGAVLEPGSWQLLIFRLGTGNMSLLPPLIWAFGPAVASKTAQRLAKQKQRSARGPAVQSVVQELIGNCLGPASQLKNQKPTQTKSGARVFVLAPRGPRGETEALRWEHAIGVRIP